jgi:hypothetical protein
MFFTNLDIPMCIQILGLQCVTQNPMLLGMAFVTGLNSAQEARPWLEITSKVDIMQSARMCIVLGRIQSWSSGLNSFLRVDLCRHFSRCKLVDDGVS